MRCVSDAGKLGDANADASDDTCIDRFPTVLSGAMHRRSATRTVLISLERCRTGMEHPDEWSGRICSCRRLAAYARLKPNSGSLNSMEVRRGLEGSTATAFTSRFRRWIRGAGGWQTKVELQGIRITPRLRRFELIARIWKRPSAGFRGVGIAISRMTCDRGTPLWRGISRDDTGGAA